MLCGEDGGKDLPTDLISEDGGKDLPADLCSEDGGKNLPADLRCEDGGKDFLLPAELTGQLLAAIPHLLWLGQSRCWECLISFVVTNCFTRFNFFASFNH
jgi:hypothetical protein